MRWAAFVLTVVLSLAFSLGGCWDLASSGGDTSTGGSGTKCSQSDGCAACTSCAEGGPCATLWQTCMGSSDCLAIDACIGQTEGCGTNATCTAGCYANNPAGQCDYEAAWNCIQCQQCTDACGMCAQ
jgi:hypothetical protein